MSIEHNINKIKELINQIELNEHKETGSVLLLAVSKQQSAEAITQAYHCGIRNFGENYFQEAEQKIQQLKNLPVCWHFIGPIQSNKTKGIASHFNWVHSIDRLKIARLLSEHRSPEQPPLNLCLQINLVHEVTKSGIACEQAQELALAVSQLPHVKLRGLMTIPPPQKNEQEQYQLFLRLQELMKSINVHTGLNMDTLSMGMSEDLIPAIKAGATIVRIGRAIFGERIATPSGTESS